MGKFQDKVKAHLASYAQNNAELSSCTFGGTFNNKKKDGKLIHYPYIFKEHSDWKLNILQDYRKSLVNLIQTNKIKEHTDAHHLNSSQMMCMNFFYPLMCKNKLSYILNIINPDEQWGEIKFATFEKISDIDGKKRGATNFDFYIETTNGHKLYFEIKYTENEFGKATADQSHIEKWEKMYKSLVNESPILNSSLITQEYFFKNYQIIRNAIHVLNPKKDYSIFIVPKDEDYDKLYKKANDVIKNAVEKGCASHVQVLSWKEVLKAVDNDPQLKDYYAKFKKKYLDF